MKPKTGVLGATIFLIFLQLSIANGAKIMFFFGVSSYSHRIAVWPLAEKLADRGHSLTFVSPYPNKTPHPTIKDYVPKSLKDWAEAWNETDILYTTRVAGNMESQWFVLPEYGLSMCEVLMNDSVYVDWITKSKFDMVIVDSLANECAYGMVYKLKAKMIVFSTSVAFPYYADPFGYSDESSWIPCMFYHYPHDMSIYQRFVTMMAPLYYNLWREFKYFPKMEALVRDKLGIPEMPGFSDIERNVSLVLVNQHYAEDYARPYPPNVVPVGGMQCSESQEGLPKDLEDFIKKSTSGFIYLSFGSYTDWSKFPKSVQTVFLNTMKKLKNIQFIWKLDKENELVLPPNVYTAKWMPQQAILSHPKIRTFITHAGLLGIQEAICNSVPLISFPIFAEQDYNANKLEFREIGIKLEITRVTEKELESAINKMLDDERYHKNMKKVSVAFRDRPARPVDTAVWWTEYVLRHDDTSILRPRSVHQSWWKRRQLDVWAILFFILLIGVRVILGVVKITYGLIFGKTHPVRSTKLKSS